MALTESNMLELGTKAPDFNLIDTISDKNMSLADVAGKKATVVMFICNHCPFVVHVNKQMVSIANDFKDKEVGFVAISSNDVENYPQDGPDKMKTHAAKEGYNFPYLFDESQEVAKAYDAACTPDYYVFDENQILVYRGRMDKSRPGNEQPNDGSDLRSAIENTIQQKPIINNQLPSAGCNIKWKK